MQPAQDLSHEKLAAFITCLSDTGSLLDELLHRISESTNSWNRFAADDGDWQYFSPSPGCPLPSENIGHYLVELGETFKDLEEVQKSLQDSKWRVDSLKTSLSLHLKQETRGAKKRNDYVADMTILVSCNHPNILQASSDPAV